ncbi:MAG TPA: cytochrome P450 [Thermoleophilaceae bacterium]|nr:cytochrome P450 [Thermoleophilaceae bacterium]
MRAVTELELPELEYFDPELRGPRFHAEMEELRERTWLARSPLGVFVLDREAAGFFLRTRSATFPGMKIAELFEIEEGPLLEEMRRNILNLNGADHRRLRNLVNPAFTPRAADRWRPAMREFLGERWGAVRDDGRCDFVAAFAKPYPSLTIARVMGAPLADAPRLHHWSNWIQRQFDAPSLMNERAEIERAVLEFYEYAHALLAERRARPGEDLLSQLLAAEAEGDRLSEVECVNLVLNVLVGGVDTTQSQLAHGMRLFCEHPEQWELLRARPELVPAAVEEILRYEPITPFTARILHEDVELRDVRFPEGTIVMVCAFTANRDLDPATAGSAGPEAFDITADRGRAKPLTFGAGIHFCLGANLARAELGEALGFLSARIERIELDGDPEYGSINGVYGLEALRLRFAPAAVA